MTIVSDKLNWSRIKLSDCCDPISVRVNNPSQSGFERYVGLEHLVTRSSVVQNWGSTQNVTSAMKQFGADDILVARRNVYLERASQVDFAGICSGDAIVLRYKLSDCDPNILVYILNTDAFWAYANSQADGTMSKRLSVQKLMEYEFALPPLDEQRRIGRILSAANNHLIQLLEASTASDNLRRAYLIETFDKILTDKSITKRKIEDVGEALMGRQRSPKYTRGISPYPYLRVANVFDGYIDTADIKSMDFNDDEFRRYSLQYGDILLNEGQSRELVGRSSIFKNEIDNCCFQNTLIRFRSETISPTFAQAYFQYCLYTGRFIGISKQTTSIAHLGAKRFAQMRFPDVSPNMEKRVSERIKDLEQTLLQITARLEHCQNLYNQLVSQVMVKQNV